MGSLLRTLTRTGFRRGLAAGRAGRGWLMLGLAAGTVRFLRRKHGEPKVTFTEKLEPGQTIVIRHLRREDAVT